MSEWRARADAFADAPYAYDYATLFDLINAARGRDNALILVLDHITDAGNMGAVLRSAEVVGATGVLIPAKRAAPVNETVYRSSAGAVEHLRVAREPNLTSALKRLKEAGFWVAGATEQASDDLWHAPLEGRLALVMGAEDTGLSRLVRATCDFEVKLPQRGVTPSLNVAQAATVLMYEWLRRAQAQDAS
jgi:23S rRNA (guanosine2251-2'-O)-methyltransferase